MDVPQFQRRPKGLTRVCLANVFEQMKLSDSDTSYAEWSTDAGETLRYQTEQWDKNWKKWFKPLDTSTPKN